MIIVKQKDGYIRGYESQVFNLTSKNLSLLRSNVTIKTSKVSEIIVDGKTIWQSSAE